MGDNVTTEKLLWELFKKTGDIKYFLLYNEYRGLDESNSRRDNPK